jgi:hypothetical protein
MQSRVIARFGYGAHDPDLAASAKLPAAPSRLDGWSLCQTESGLCQETGREGRFYRSIRLASVRLDPV